MNIFNESFNLTNKSVPKWFTLAILKLNESFSNVGDLAGCLIICTIFSITMGTPEIVDEIRFTWNFIDSASIGICIKCTLVKSIEDTLSCFFIRRFGTVTPSGTIVTVLCKIQHNKLFERCFQSNRHHSCNNHCMLLHHIKWQHRYKI